MNGRFTLSQLPPATPDGDILVLATQDHESRKLDLKTAVQKWATEAVAVAVVRCAHCGQWGARFCECRKCGAPIE